MGTGYALAYRLGVTPWERAGVAGATQMAHLLDREESERTRPLGRALDLGCGTGAHTLELAARGWEATGLDNIGRAVAKARNRNGADTARFILGDVTELQAAGIEPGVAFFLDVGCFHGLTAAQRAAYGAGVTTLASPGATLLMLAFRPARRVGIARGADERELALALPAWSMLDHEPADSSGMPRPLRSTAPCWFRLRRVS